MEDARDFLNRPIGIGDYVVFPGAYNGGMKLGKIIKFTPKNLRVEHPGWYGEPTSTLRIPNQCVKVEGPDLTFFLLSKQNQS
jgi:hypothetical protein